MDFPYGNYLDRYINTKNANRFFNEDEMVWLNKYKEGNNHNIDLNNLRVSKAKYLYYKIREKLIIGCVVGVALIFGLYIIFYRKNK